MWIFYFTKSAPLISVPIIILSVYLLLYTSSVNTISTIGQPPDYVSRDADGKIELTHNNICPAFVSLGAKVQSNLSARMTW